MRLDVEFGSYRVQELLYSDDVVQVFLAYHLTQARTAVLTRLPADYLRDPQFEARFQSVMSHAASVQHPFVASPTDYGIEQGTPFVARDYYPGGALMQQLRVTSSFPIDETIEHLSGIAAALDTLHADGLIHGGLRPQALLRDDADRLCLSGVGLGEICYQMSGNRSSTLAYTAPEVFLRAPGTESMDIYSLGVIAYQMLTGALPYEGATSIQMLRSHLNTPVGESARLDRPILDVLRKAMSKIPSARYRSAGEMVAALKLAAYGGSPANEGDDSADEPARIWEHVAAAPAKLRWVKTQPVVGRQNLGQLYVTSGASLI